MKELQKFSNNLFSIAVQTSDGNYSFDLESVARSLGITDKKNGIEYVRWKRVNDYLGENSPQVEKGDFIPESMVYKLAFKAGNATAEKFQDWLAIEVLPQIRKTGSYKPDRQPQQPDDLFIKRMNAEARLKNANARQAKLLAELAKDAFSEVNKAILHDKAVQSLTGEKLLEMPATGKHFNDCEEIAKKVGVYSENGNPHGTAISQLIKQKLILVGGEQEVFPEYKGGWSGTVTKYADCVIDKVKEWLSDNGYPTILKLNKNYKVVYK